MPSRTMQQQEGTRPRVCRRLFADDLEPVDPGVHDNLINQVTEEIEKHLDVACKKYNFDFRSEVPLEGDWEWEPMDGRQPPRPAPPVEASSELQVLREPPVDLQEPADSQHPPADPQHPPADPQQPPADSQQPPAGR